MISSSELLSEEATNLLIQMPLPVCVFRGPKHIYELANEHYLAMVNHRDVIGKSLREVWPEAEGQGFFELFDRIYLNGESFHIHESKATIDWHQTGQLEDVWFHLIYQPFCNRQGEVAGILHIALDITEQVRMQRDGYLHEQLQTLYEEQQRHTRLVQRILDNSPSAIFAKACDGKYILANNYSTSFIGLDPSEVVGKTDDELYPPEVSASWSASEQYVFASGEIVECEETVQLDETTTETFLSIKFPLYDERGDIYAIGVIATNITNLKHGEAAFSSLQEPGSSDQRDPLRELSIPLLPLEHNVLAMPLVGTIDSNRAQQITEMLLDGIAMHHANVVIVDVTGVMGGDMPLAQAIVQVSQAVGLLGAEVVLTGIQPHLVQNLMRLGADVNSIVTRSSFQSGIAYALGKNMQRSGHMDE
jgi:anti-anti-sigma regulatory factor/PAS domain-containing protein